MNGLKAMLMGIALICFSGFFIVGQALDIVGESIVTWGMLFGLLLCFLGLLADDGDGDDGSRAVEAGGAESGNEESGDGEGGDEKNGDGEGGDAEEGDTEGDNESEKNRDRYAAGRFPPM